MEEGIITLAIKDFGPAGGLAVLLLAASVWANWKLILRLNKNHDALIILEKAHAQELAECRLRCEQEKTVYQAQLEARFKEACSIFLDRDNQKRSDIATMFTRFENLMGVITSALTKWTEVVQDLKSTVRDAGRHQN